MLIESISEYIELQEKDKQHISRCFSRDTYSKDTILLREGSYAKHLYFVERGFIRSFYYKDDGAEKTHWIYNDHDFVTAWYSFFTGKPGFENLQVIGESSIYSVTLSDYHELYKNNQAFNAFINYYYQQTIAEMDFLAKTFTQLSAKEKYRYLLDTSPNLLHEIKLGYIASLLDISQETLSRVRRQV